MITRRDFNKASVLTGLGLATGNVHSVLGKNANSTVTIAVAGIRSRGLGLVKKFASLKNCSIKYVVDVDSRYLPLAAQEAEKIQNTRPQEIKDFRRVLDDKDVNALVIATPDHWHAPMTIEAVKAGKHVYVEKPCGHNPAEGEMLIEAENKYDKLIQMGNQRRSIPIVEQMIQEIHEGAIGNAYFAHTWYAKKRSPIGFGNEAAVPDYLDWELWQGPAPRAAYRDNIHPYNWHWFWNWGTGEALNNGTHELDIARWALGVDYPSKVTSLAGRMHYDGQDDWECYDTQNISVKFPKNKMITWEGISCVSFKMWGAPRGVMICGTKGRIEYTSGYKVFDLDNKLLREEGFAAPKTDVTNTRDPGLNDSHAENFVNSILGQETINSPMIESHKSVLMGHLGNIAARTATTIQCDPNNGHIIKNDAAQKLWSRKYESGWQPTI